ncbi:uncharacterized protein JCM15063_000543 [Sporobolomyces koalae]|uniref:uncharacterized protein n=1 Tax=Sporobolomyces koalae TaxID=500713 RepID=UPI0031782211
MGVQGLWSLLAPVARPITPESLKDKRLAVDASIWLYQFQMAVRSRKSGDAIHGNHIRGVYTRILKLLHWGIKPVFVFDGDAHVLKKRTIEKRKRRREGAGRDLAKTAQQLLSAQLRNHAAENALAQRKNTEVSETAPTTPKASAEDAVYLEDLEAGRATAKIPTTPATVKKARKEAMRDEYALPAIEGTLESRVKVSDPRVATAEEFQDFINDLRPEDLDINSDFFGNLPPEVKYEILGELRVKTRQVNHKRNQEMRGAATAIDFSRAQIDNLMERNHYTQKLLAVTDELGTSAIAIPTRVAGTRNREYLLVKQDASKGGGWVLGVKNPELGSNEPITLDTTTDESVGAHTDTDEFEEVGIEGDSSPPKAPVKTPDAETQRLLAVEAVRARYAANPGRPDANAHLNRSVPINHDGPALFVDGEDNDDPDLQEALLDSMRPARPSASPTPIAPIRSTGDDSDDSMEYVEIAPGVASTAPNDQPEGSDDSDAFHEVDVPASRRPSPPVGIQVEPPSTPPAPTLLETVLLSDSDSETNSPRRPASPPRQPNLATPPADNVTARDFGEEEFTPRSKPSGSRNVDVQPVDESPVALLNLRFAETQSKFRAPSPRQLSPPISPNPPRPVSPVPSVSLPPRSPLPTERTDVDVTNEDFKSVLPAEADKSTMSAPLPDDRESPLAESPERQPLSPSRTPRRSPTPRKRSPALFREPSTFDPDAVYNGDTDTARAFEPQNNRGLEQEAEEEEEYMLPWSRSPTPPANANRSKGRQDDRAGPSQDLIEAAINEASKGVQAQHEEYSEIARTLGRDELEAMKDCAASDMASLLKQRNAEKRNADGITRQMAIEIKEMLILFGIPFLDAPQEAEAECASLLERSLVDGVVTDDSDVFLFGASRVYRHMFDGNKYLECYLSSDLERELNLDRDKLVRLAYLLGGDYDDGLPGIGPVLARELVDEFDGKDGLKRFRDWWRKVEDGRDTERDTNTSWKRKFKKGHKALVLEGSWPKPEIARAYYNPVVHESDEPFSWGGVDLDGLLIFFARTMGWPAEYCMKDLKPLIDRLTAIKEGRERLQKSLPDFFDPSAGHEKFSRKKPVKYASERLQNVIKNWKNQQASNQDIKEDDDDGEEKEEDEAELVAPTKAKKRRTASPATSRANSRSKASKST